MQRSTLSCLYFPYADPKPSPSMLMATLLFDRIYFLEPNFFQPPTARFNEQSFLGTIPQELDEIGVFHEIGPDLMGFGKDFGLNHPVFDSDMCNEIRSSIISDLSNQKLKELVLQYEKVYWRIPNGQFLFWNGLGLLFDITKDNPKLQPLEILSSRTDYYEPFIKQAGYTVHLNSYEDARIRGIPEELMVRVPFILAEALMITVALRACTDFQLVPFTDDFFHHRYLVSKLQSLVDSQVSLALGEIQKGISYTQLGTKSIELSLPKIENLTAKKVRKLREICSDELIRFRVEMNNLTRSIETNLWDPDYEWKLRESVETKVQVSIMELKDKLLSLREKFEIQLVEKSLTTAPLPFLLNITVGLPIAWVLPASVGASWLLETLKYFQQKSELKKNGLSFLLRFN